MPRREQADLLAALVRARCCLLGGLGTRLVRRSHGRQHRHLALRARACASRAHRCRAPVASLPGMSRPVTAYQGRPIPCAARMGSAFAGRGTSAPRSNTLQSWQDTYELADKQPQPGQAGLVREKRARDSRAARRFKARLMHRGRLLQRLLEGRGVRLGLP